MGIEFIKVCVLNQTLTVLESFQPIIPFRLPEFILENFSLTSIDQQNGVFQVNFCGFETGMANTV